MANLRIVGDVHGQFDKYLDIIKDSEYSLQVGDLGFNYAPLTGLDSTRHRFIAGNHDNHNILPAHALGRFGVWKVRDLTIFYVSGATSIDKFYRTPFVDWWPNEELNFEEQREAFDLYKQVKPKTVVTHDCPSMLRKFISDPEALKRYIYSPDWESDTQKLLQSMFDYHVPNQWIFGHYHKDWTYEAVGCHFICLDELHYIDLHIKE